MLSLLLTLLLLALPAWGASWSSSAEHTRAEGSRALALPDGDVVLLREQQGGRYAVERWSHDLELRWRTFFEIPARRERRSLDAMMREVPLFDLEPIALLGDDFSRAVGVTDEELRVLDAAGGEAVAFRFSLETGEQSRLVLHAAEPGRRVRVLGGGRATAVLVSGDEDEEVLLLDAALQRRAALRLPAGRRPHVDALGRFCAVGDVDDALELSCVNADATGWERTRVPRGSQPALSARFVADGAHHGYVVAMLAPAPGRSPQLLVARVHVGAPEAIVVTRVGLQRLLTGLYEGDPRWLVLRGALVSPDGDLVLHGQFVTPELESPAIGGLDPNTAFERWALSSGGTISFDYHDVVAFDFGADGGLRWTAALPVDQRTHADSLGETDRLIESAGYSAAQVGGVLRVQYAHQGNMDLVSGVVGRRVLSQDIRLSDGAVGEPRELLRLGAEEQYLRSLSMPLGEEEWLVSFRVRMAWTLPDTTLIGRVGDEPAVPVPLSLSDSITRGGERYLTGQLLGYHDAMVAREWQPAALGLGLGGGGASAAVLGTWFVLGATPGGCCLASVVGCAGCATGVGLARVIGGTPALGPDGEPEMVAGYRAGYRRGQRTLQARWAFVGGISAVSVAAVVASSGVVGRLMSPLPP
ncbi:MAG: hypothetical protein H6740_12165 [Alphaproteobacteria bacterium]|nr:hypothetical protein [Alphaproteobacteria bacterium]